MNVIKLALAAARIRPQLNKLKELTAMPLNWSRFWQIVATLLQILNLVLPITDGKVKIYVATGIGILQVVLHNLAGNVNPDGTPATVAYVDSKK